MATTVTPTVALEKAETSSSDSAPTAPAAGIVSNHATTMRCTTFQCTVPPARPRPAPMIPPETVCVVESEKPKYDDARIVVEDAVSAEKPCGDWISVTRVPSVLITRQPPENVPSAIAVAHTTLTHVGTLASADSLPPATSVSTTTPIVFWASFVPCASATIELDAIWLRRNPVVDSASSTERVSRYE